MKKILSILILSFCLASLSYAENNSGSTNTSTGNSAEKQANISQNPLEQSSSGTISSGMTQEKAAANPIENASYTYYYGEGCKYCKQFSKYMDSVGGWDKLNIDKREVWSNRDNAVKMASDMQRLGLDSSTLTTPFLVINSNGKETALTGLDQLMAYFEPILGKSTVSANDDNNLVDTTTNNPVKTEEQKRNSTWFLIIVALIACGSSYGFIKASNKK
ncbi:hypothetical protein BKN14_04790 [Candidatus Gracilibacteria bacterium HOT-871]|nr:hypothetical protein BKN14_04790 [Candidatus Gracilibacteria bacterium HOT-871]MBB1565097.1 hypothetical protein [Candidatus Gracilibacteria bacterium]RKW20458.1 MAG: hypothetical protein D8B46_09595 [Candidatus Gracilibacteria bacterium]